MLFFFIDILRVFYKDINVTCKYKKFYFFISNLFVFYLNFSISLTSTSSFTLSKNRENRPSYLLTDLREENIHYFTIALILSVNLLYFPFIILSELPLPTNEYLEREETVLCLLVELAASPRLPAPESCPLLAPAG